MASFIVLYLFLLASFYTVSKLLGKVKVIVPSSKSLMGENTLKELTKILLNKAMIKIKNYISNPNISSKFIECDSHSNIGWKIEVILFSYPENSNLQGGLL